ncbi:MAG: MFS transporter [Acidobacteria bacterium]|nr:MFS transporter [Acidobacteriota bacterium]
MPPKWKVATRALRHRNYRLFFAGQLFSLVGTWVQSVAQAWLVYRLTGSPVMLGVVAFASQVPYLVLAPIAGVVADRVSRHKLILAAQVLAMVQAFVLAALTLSGRVEVWHVFFLALGLGIVNVFDMTARQAFLVEMVGKEDLLSAIALNSSIVNAGRIIGPAVAGITVAAVGEGYCFLLNAVSYAAIIVGLLLMRLPVLREHGSVGSPLERLQEGWSYVRRHRPVRSLLLLLGILTMMNYPLVLLMPLFADQILGGGPKTLGFLMSSIGAGAILGALYMASRTSLQGLTRKIALATACYGLAVIFFAASANLLLSALLLAPVGFCLMLQIAGINTSVQTIVPDALRARVMGFYALMFMGTTPVGSLMGGWLAKLIGAPWTVALGGAVCLVAAYSFNRQRPIVRAALRRAAERDASMTSAAVSVAIPSGSAG